MLDFNLNTKYILNLSFDAFLFFHIWVHTCVLVPYKFFSYNFHCVFEVSLLFSNSSLGLLCFHCYYAGWNLSQKLILWVKNSEILDLSSFICWGKVKKRYIKIQNTKEMKNKIRTECKNSDSGKMMMRQWSWKKY